MTKAINNAGTGAENAWKIPLLKRLVAAVERESNHFAVDSADSEDVGELKAAGS